MLEGFAWPELERAYADAENFTLDDLVFMQDGAPPHFGGLEWLDNHFEDRWMGRGTHAHPAPYPWPPRSPDLTPMDYFLWGYLKTKVYANKLTYTSVAEMKTAIEREMRAVPIAMIRKALTDGYRRRLQACVMSNGGHIEVE